MWGEGTEDGAGLRAARLVPRASLGAEAWSLHFNVARQRGEGISPALGTRRGLLQGPRTDGGACGRAGPCPPLGLGSVPRPKMAPGRCLPRDCGASRAPGGGGGKDQGAHGAAGFSGWPARAPRTLQFGEQAQPGAVLSRPAPASPGPAAGPGSAGAGVSVSREGAARRLGLTKAGVRVLEEGASPAPNRGPNEMQARFATLTKRTLGKCKRHWQIQGKQAEFLLATK